MGWWPCGGCNQQGIDVSGCSQCSGSGGRGPNQFQSVISGVTAGGFPPCCGTTDVNGTWVLTYNPTICAWVYDISGGSLGTWTCVSAVTLVRHSLTIQGPNGVYRISIFSGASLLGDIRWQRNTSPTNIDCFALSSSPFAFLSTTSCVGNSSTNLVTAL